MMHEKDERPPNEKITCLSFSITYNRCEFRLLTLLQFLLSQNAYLKDGVCKGVLAIRRIFSLVDIITTTKFSNCPCVFKIDVVRQ